MFYTASTLASPADLYSVGFDGGKPRQLTRVNQEELAARRLGEYQQFNFAGANGDNVFGYVVKPANFKRDQKYPVAFLIHGGPQGSMANVWHWRWNAQVFAGAGYGVVMIDFHGSTGYGQAFTDSISGDWGGKPLEDLKLGLAAALKQFPWLDGDEACALGGSYGGFMINWIAGAVARPVQMPGLARRHLRSAQHVLLHRGAVVSGMGKRRPGICESGRHTPNSIRSTMWPNGRRRCW